MCWKKLEKAQKMRKLQVGSIWKSLGRVGFRSKKVGPKILFLFFILILNHPQLTLGSKFGHLYQYPVLALEFLHHVFQLFRTLVEINSSNHEITYRNWGLLFLTNKHLQRATQRLFTFDNFNHFWKYLKILQFLTMLSIFDNLDNSCKLQQFWAVLATLANFGQCTICFDNSDNFCQCWQLENYWQCWQW